MFDIDPWQPACAEYFRDFAEGRFDQAGQFWFILPEAEIQVALDRGDLVIGRSGCDDIEFCFRRGMKGVWTYSPIKGEHVMVAPDLRTLSTGWEDGSITVQGPA
jgi:hypothetical protein